VCGMSTEQVAGWSQPVCGALGSREKSVTLARTQTLDCISCGSSRRHYYNTARYQHQTEWRSAHEETLGGGGVNKDGAVALGNNCRCHATHQHTSNTADRTSRLSSVFAAGHPDVAAAPACRLIVLQSADVTTHQRFHGEKGNMSCHVQRNPKHELVTGQKKVHQRAQFNFCYIFCTI